MTTYQTQNFPCQEVALFLGHGVILPFSYLLDLSPLKFAFCYAGMYGEEKDSHLFLYSLQPATLLRDKRDVGQFPSWRGFFTFLTNAVTTK